MSRGESHYACKLSTADVELIRAAADERRRLLDEARKLSNKALAEKMGTCVSNVERIVSMSARKWG